MEKTFVMVKPDGVQRGLVGEIINRLEKKGLKLSALKMLKIPVEQAEIHYGEHRDKPFFRELVGFINSGPVVAMVWEGENAIGLVRKIMGATNPAEAAPGTIRGCYGVTIDKNVIHGSDSPESAAREIALFFQETELVDYELTLNSWIY